MEDARRRLGEVTKNPAEYKVVLEKLILQALFQTMEPTVILRCRQVDVGLVNEVLPAAVEEYKKQMMNQGVSVDVDTDNYLPADTCGGIELIALNGRIKVSVILNMKLRATNMWKKNTIANVFCNFLKIC